MVYCTVVPLTTASTQFTAAEFCPASNVAYGRSFSFWHVDSETRLGRRVEVNPFARLVSHGTRKASQYLARPKKGQKPFDMAFAISQSTDETLVAVHCSEWCVVVAEVRME